jgi:membrane protein
MIFRLFKKAAVAWMDDNAMRLSAALSYYSIFSIAPLLLIAIGFIGFIANWGVLGFGPDQVQDAISKELPQLVGPQAAQSMQAMIGSAQKTSGQATFIGFIVLFVGASSVFGQLKESLNTVWGVRQKPGLGIMGFIRERMMSFGMVLVIGFLLLISLALSVFIAAMNGWLEVYLHLPKAVSGIFGFLLPLSVETLLFALLFKYVPDAKIQWRCVWLGALVTAILFEIGKTGLAWYLGQASTTSSFGAASSLVSLLLWVFYASCILFLGAEFTEVYAAEAKAAIEPKEVAERVPEIDGLIAAGATKVHVEPDPLHPDAPVPSLPMKESLAPLLATTMVPAEAIRPVRPVRIQRSGWEGWLDIAREHPAAQVGAALGVGLLAGAISRAMDKQTPAMSATEHFAEGSRKTVDAGRSLFAVAVAWAARHLTKTALRHYAETAQETGAHWSHALAHRVEKAMR